MIRVGIVTDLRVVVQRKEVIGGVKGRPVNMVSGVMSDLAVDERLLMTD